MTKRLMFFAALVAAVLSVSLAASSAIGASVVYNAIPSPLPPNVASLGFEAQSTSEFGDYVHLTSTNPNRVLNAVTVTMSDWALYSDYSTDFRYSGNSSTWSHPITVNVYSNHLGANGAPDTLLATKTQNVAIPWRPVADASCGTAWKASNGNCYNGLAFNATFDLSSLNQALPNDVIVGVAYNTADYGQAPIGVAGPYNSLNVGVPTGQTASVGSDANADNVFWNTSYAPFYADGGASGVGTFRQDTNWSPNGTVAIQITASAACTETDFSRDGHVLTAAQIGGNVTGTLDATGCDIGVYYKSGSTGDVMAGADISGAKYFGVLVNGVPANVTGSSVHSIGDVPLNGSQHGNAIVYLNGATGTISGNHVYSYQKNGITVSGVKADGSISGPATSASVLNNVVTGEGPVSYIAQNGIQVSYGASGTVTGNTVSNNWYTGATWTACGLLFYQAGGVKQNANNLFNNQTNFCNFGRGGGKPPRP
jgi:parallel beta-helix repeat protein